MGIPYTLYNCVDVATHLVSKTQCVVEFLLDSVNKDIKVASVDVCEIKWLLRLEAVCVCRPKEPTMNACTQLPLSCQSTPAVNVNICMEQSSFGRSIFRKETVMSPYEFLCCS